MQAIDMFDDKLHNRCVKGYNLERLYHQTPESCAKACIDKGPDCVGFEIVYGGNYSEEEKNHCNLSSSTYHEDCSSWFYDFYVRKPTSTALQKFYGRWRDWCVKGFNLERLYNQTPETCAQACIDKGTQCLAIEFAYKGSKKGLCTLSSSFDNVINDSETCNYIDFYERKDLRPTSSPTFPMCIATGEKCGTEQNPDGHPCCNSGICILKSDGKYCESEETQTCIGTGEICGRFGNPNGLPCCNGGDCVSIDGGGKICTSPTCVGSGQFCGLQVNPDESPCCDDTHHCQQVDGGKKCMPFCIASEQRCGSEENPDELQCCDDHHTCQLVPGEGRFCKPRTCVAPTERCDSVENPDGLPCCNGYCEQTANGKICIRDDRSQCKLQTGDTCIFSNQCCDKNDRCGYYGGFARKTCSPPCILNGQRCGSAANPDNLPCCTYETRTHVFDDQQCLPDDISGVKRCDTSYIKPFDPCDDEANPGQKDCSPGYGCYKNFLEKGNKKYCLTYSGPIDSKSSACDYSDPLDKFDGTHTCGKTAKPECLYPNPKSSIPGTMICTNNFDARTCEMLHGKMCADHEEMCRNNCRSDSSTAYVAMCYIPSERQCLSRNDANFDRDEISFDDFCRNMGGMNC